MRGTLLVPRRLQVVEKLKVGGDCATLRKISVFCTGGDSMLLEGLRNRNYVEHS